MAKSPSRPAVPSKSSDTAAKPRATRTSLHRDRIESEALALIEAQGLDAFTTRKLGERLGCEAMSVYYHFPSKAHLLDALVDRLLAALPIPPRDLAPAARLRAMVQSWRTMAGQYPRFYLWMAVHRWNSAIGVGFLAEVLDCFHAAGLDTQSAARGFRALGYYVLGGTLDETSGYAQGPSAMNPIDDAQIQASYPQVHAASRYFVPVEYDRTFELGLGVLLQGLGVEPSTMTVAPEQPPLPSA